MIMISQAPRKSIESSRGPFPGAVQDFAESSSRNVSKKKTQEDLFRLLAAEVLHYLESTQTVANFGIKTHQPVQDITHPQ